MKKMIIAIGLFVAVVSSAYGQTNGFNYQGSLKDGANQANGNFDFEFALFDSLAGGTQQGATLSRNNVVVANGVFSVSLDFGNQFPGASRFLEIRVRPTGQPSFTPLAPRQTVGSSPYGVRSLNAASADTAATAANAFQLGGVAANQYIQTNGNGSGLTNLNAGSITTGTLAVSRGGTGSATQNFVDLSTDQSGIGGNKAFTGNLTFNGSTAVLYPTSGSGLFYIRNRTSSNSSALIFSDHLNNYRGYLEYVGANAGLGIRNDTVELGTNATALTFRPNETEVMRMTTAGNVGIGTTNPASKLHVFGSGAVRINADSDLNAGFGLSLNNQLKWSVATVSPGQFQIFNQTLVSNALWIDNATNNVGIGSTSPAATLEVNGYTKLGSDAPAIRVIKLTGTTAANEGGSVNIPHGLDPSKILLISVMVNFQTNQWISPSYTVSNGRHFNFFLEDGEIKVIVVLGQSAQLLSKPIKIFITYEQ